MIRDIYAVWAKSDFAKQFYGTFAEFYGVIIKKFALGCDSESVVKYLNDVEREIDELASWEH